MPETIVARLNHAISQPELSKMWESERTTFNPGTGDGIDTFLSAPELVFEVSGNEVRILFTASKDPDHRRLKEAFERAVRRYMPDVKIDWKEQTRSAG
jgi:hypothetical protein